MSETPTPEKIERARHLVALAHHIVNHPVSTGPVWSKYSAQDSRTALDALFEAHMLLSGKTPQSEGKS